MIQVYSFIILFSNDDVGEQFLNYYRKEILEV